MRWLLVMRAKEPMCDGGPNIRDSLASSQGAGPRGRDEQQRASETWAAMSRTLCVVVS